MGDISSGGLGTKSVNTNFKETQRINVITWDEY